MCARRSERMPSLRYGIWCSLRAAGEILSIKRHGVGVKIPLTYGYMSSETSFPSEVVQAGYDA